jgi:hypothetical protein
MALISICGLAFVFHGRNPVILHHFLTEFVDQICKICSTANSLYKFLAASHFSLTLKLQFAHPIYDKNETVVKNCMQWDVAVEHRGHHFSMSGSVLNTTA